MASPFRPLAVVSILRQYSYETLGWFDSIQDPHFLQGVIKVVGSTFQLPT